MVQLTLGWTSWSALQDFQEEQDLVARLVHRLRSPDPAQRFAMLRTAWERLSVGGPHRLRHTIPPIAFAALHIARQKAAAGSGQPTAQEVSACTALQSPAKLNASGEGRHLAAQALYGLETKIFSA